MKRLLTGALVGAAATAPMTLAMVYLHRRLPEGEQYPLPPRQVAMRLAEEAGVRDQLAEPEKTGLTLASHFAYGAAIGAAFAPLVDKVKLPPVATGMGFGLAVWAGSYLGWLPAAGILSPATSHPARRNALMIAAHLVWGASAGALIGMTDDGKKARGRRV